MSLIRIEKLCKTFPAGRIGLLGKKLHLIALNNVDLSIKNGEIMGLVGESGCGKSTLGKILLRLIEPDSGKIFFEDTDLLSLKGEKLRKFRKNMQLIFQDPYSSLNPKMTVEEIVGEPLEIHGFVKNKEQRRKLVAQRLAEVGINEDALDKYPHAFSGGQRQRIGIARALAVRPRFVVADEPVSALDVSIRAQILNLITDLQQKLNLTMLFISHDLHVIRYLSDRIAVMYLGKIVEILPSPKTAPKHPYTQALDAAAPHPKKKIVNKTAPLKGEPPSQITPPTGCVFHPRCPKTKDVCKHSVPDLKEIAPGHMAACHMI